MSPEFEVWLQKFLMGLFLLIAVATIVNLYPSLSELFKREVVVDVCGAVKEPGVYTFRKGARVIDALRRAKPLASADIEKLNLARKLRDGEKIRVPFKGELRINLNQASLEEILKLPGITRTIAKRIVKYRERYGPITSENELLKIKGMNLELLRKIEPYIDL